MALVQSELAKDPLTNRLAIEKKIYAEHDGFYALLPNNPKNFIQDQIRLVNNEIDKSDFELMRYYKTPKEEYFCHSIKMKQKFLCCVFFSQLMLKKISDNPTHIFIDGYFKVPKPQYYQLLTIYTHEIINGKTGFYPICFILMQGKDEASYLFALSEALHEIKTNIPAIKDWQPKFITTDFELGLIKAVKKTFPLGTNKGCMFHFIQALWKRASKEGLRQKKHVKTTAQVITSLVILGFISTERVKKGFDAIKTYMNSTNLMKTYESFLKYFESTWINGQFGVEMWNYHNETNRYDNIKLTNNCVESMHAQLSKALKYVI